MKGKGLTEEHRRKISLAIRGKKHPRYGKKCSDEHRKKISETLIGRYLGSESPVWNRDGRYVDKQGYVWVRNVEHPKNHKGWIQEHRLVMEKKLGRLLKSHEIVHHRNGIKDDNRDKNLKLMNRRAHQKSYKQAFSEGFAMAMVLFSMINFNKEKQNEDN